MRYVIGDLRTGRRIQNVSAQSGRWSEELNDAGVVSCVVPLTDPTNAALDLYNTAAVGKAFLAAVEGDLILQAGPIWVHDWNEDEGELELIAGGMWTYFDHRVLLPVLAGRLPTDPTTDTRYWPVVSDPDADGYPWPTDTRTSFTTMVKRLVEQAQSWTGGNVPVVLPSEIAGTSERWFRGADLAWVGDRLRQLTEVLGGPDIMFTPRWKVLNSEMEWVLRVGTPTQPMLFSPQRQKFRIGNAGSSVSHLRHRVDGTEMGSSAYGSGGKGIDLALTAVSTDPTLINAGYSQMDLVEPAHPTVSEPTTLQQYTDELAVAGRTPISVSSFDHQLTERPYLSDYNAGDFADLRVHKSLYLPVATRSMRLLTRSGTLEGDTVSLQYAPEVI